MILSRIASALRRQDWVTVFIEFALVVAGVLVALQLDNWNQERQTRAEEKRLVSQLNIELEAAITTKEAWLQSSEAWWRTLASGIEVIQNTEEAELTTEQCQSMWASHLIFFGNSNLATLDEILASGRLELLGDKSLRNSLLNFAAARKQSAEMQSFVRSDFANLVDVHADAFPRYFDDIPADISSRSMSHIPVNTHVECAIDKIRSNQTIKNKLISNLARTTGVLNAARNEVDQMRSLHSHLNRQAR